MFRCKVWCNRHKVIVPKVSTSCLLVFTLCVHNFILITDMHSLCVRLHRHDAHKSRIDVCLAVKRSANHVSASSHPTCRPIIPQIHKEVFWTYAMSRTIRPSSSISKFLTCLIECKSRSTTNHNSWYRSSLDNMILSTYQWIIKTSMWSELVWVGFCRCIWASIFSLPGVSKVGILRV